jgi:hypothetical protein
MAVKVEVPFSRSEFSNVRSHQFWLLDRRALRRGQDLRHPLALIAGRGGGCQTSLETLEANLLTFA